MERGGQTVYDEEERRRELIRRRAMRRKRRMREKRKRVRRRRLMLSLIVAVLLLLGLIRLSLAAYSKIDSWMKEKTAQPQQTESSEQAEKRTEPSNSMVIITTSAGLNVRTGPGTAYPRLTTLSGGTIVSTGNEKNNWSQIAEGSYAENWMCSDYVSRLREEDGRATVIQNADLYAGPSETNFQRLGQLSNEDVVRLLYSAKVEGKTWYEVQMQAYIGWIAGDSVQIHEKQ